MGWRLRRRGYLSLPVSSSMSTEERGGNLWCPFTPIMASLLHDKDKGPRYSPLDSHLKAGGPDPLGEFSTK